MKERTILIPTDFTVESLVQVRYAAENYTRCRLKIVLLHCSRLNDSVSDMLFYSPARIIRRLAGPNFREACAILRNKHEHIAELRIELFHGKTKSAFRNFINAHGIQTALIPARYELQLGDSCFDPLPFIRESSLELFEIDWHFHKGHETNQLSALFSE